MKNKNQGEVNSSIDMLLNEQKENQNKKSKGIANTLIIVSVLALVLCILVVIVLNMQFIQEKIISRNFEQGEQAKDNELFDPSTLVDTEHAYIVQDSEGINVPVPKGYVASPIEEGFEFFYTNVSESIIISDGGENTIRKGFVIYEMLDTDNGDIEQAKQNILDDPWIAQQERNQWVWVPVPDSSQIYRTDENGKKWGERLNLSIFNKDTYTEPDIMTIESIIDTKKIGIRTIHDFLIQLEKEFEQSITSIEKYGGFYIGRYETGDLSKTYKIVRMNTDLIQSSWIDKYYKCKKDLKGENKNINTSMIWGSHWDRCLKWLIDCYNNDNSTGKSLDVVETNSRSWGNYFTDSWHPGIDYISLGGNKKNTLQFFTSGITIPSGSSETTKANNIYDLAGNVGDSTLMVSSDVGRMVRGGDCYAEGDSTTRYNTSASGYKSNANYRGCRSTLYIK